MLANWLSHFPNTLEQTWYATEGHPLAYVLKYIFFGDGETAPLTREILRSVEKNDERRPLIHVG